ncbi:YidC/Oxa1 family membrane protein insertase [Paenibacillus sp. CMAA1364]
MSRLKNRRGVKWILLSMMIFAMTILSGCGTSGAAAKTTDQLLQGGFWQRNVVYWFATALDTFADWFGGQYGLAVLMMVIIVRTLILPLTIKQVRSSRAMQAIQPELAKLKEKYKDNPEQQQQETMKLFQENKVNPLAGCLPLIVQMPIFIALYNSIYGNELLRHGEFLWLQLGSPDKTFILPLLAAITTFLQTKMMMKMNPSPQQGAMQFMMMVYPVLIFFMSYNFPAALPLYWFFSNLYTLIQNYFLYRNNPNTATVSGITDTGSSKSNIKSTKGKGNSNHKHSGKKSKGAKKSK